MPVDPRKIGDVIASIIEHLPAHIIVERVQIRCRVGYKEVSFGVSPLEASANDSDHIGKIVAENISRDLR